MRSARSTVLVFTSRTAARSRAGGNRSPGHASPEARARRISPATWSCSATASVRSTLTSIIVLCIVALCIVAVPDETLPPTEVLIPEARRHQRRRYLRTAITAVLAALVVGALVVGAVVLVSGPAAGGKRSTGSSSVATAGLGPVVLRPVLCFADPYLPSAQSDSGPLPNCGAPYLLTATALNVAPDAITPDRSSNRVPPDPVFTPYASTAHDAAGSVELLGGLPGSAPGLGGSSPNRGERYVLGPVVMRLSASDIESAGASPIANGSQEWLVVVQLSSAAAARWDTVAQREFPSALGGRPGRHGGLVSHHPATQTSFSSLEGKMEISGLTEQSATSLAAAINARH